ncbi:MFS transporter [Peribacillus alkalitolerans]|uniref:MFS transporter n=1 Tax=Peribacillus alkalitolerans TaxID=1550385 RepID=UPI0013D55364|nr:MFS transporter [Peribacillus alkalitolerans]
MAGKLRLHYGWIIVVISFIALLTGAGIRSAPSVLMVPLEDEFEWNRTVMSLTLGINLVLYGLIGPFAAALMNKYGVRKVISTAFLILFVGISFTTMIRHSWQMYIFWGVLVGVGSGCTVVLSTIVSNRWFVKRRGLVIGILTASGATGQMIFLPFLTKAIHEYGWRNSVLVIAGFAFLVFILSSLFLRNHPHDVGAVPYGSSNEDNEVTSSSSSFLQVFSSLKQAASSKDFWFLGFSFFICGLSTNGLIGSHFIPACIDFGFTPALAAGMLATIGIFDMIGTILSGWLSDRFNSRWLLFWYYSLRGLSLLFLPWAFTSGYIGLWGFIIFYGLDWVATVPPTIRLTTDIFGKEKAGILFGWIMGFHQMGAAIAAYGSGIIRSYIGTYTLSFIMAGALCLVGSALVLRIGKGKSVQMEQKMAVN